MKNLNEYRSELINISKDFIIINEVDKRRNRRHFKFKHLICSTEFETDFSSLKGSILKNNGGCPECAKEKRMSNLNHKITKEEFINYLDSIKEKDYRVENIWFNKEDKRSYATLTHVSCKRSFNQRINDFKNRI